MLAPNFGVVFSLIICLLCTLIDPVLCGTAAVLPYLQQRDPGTVGNGIALRILPIGDSITAGFKSSDNNGYRQRLERSLNTAGNYVQYVGSQRTGDNNTDNEQEGFGGLRISQIAARAEADGVLYEHPNVVLLMAGTNDMNQAPPQESYEGAPNRLADLIDDVVCECPDAVILVAKIVDEASCQDRINTFNSAIPGLVTTYRSKGYKIRVADQSNVGGAYLAPDGVHPNDDGYQLIAENFFLTLKDTPASWFTPARDASKTNGTAPACSEDINPQPGANGSQPATGLGHASDHYSHHKKSHLC